MTDDAQDTRRIGGDRAMGGISDSLETRSGLSPLDLARHAAAAAAADDPELVFGPAFVAFCDIRPLLLAGELRAADGAMLAVQDWCLKLCVSESTSAVAADDKVRFLRILIGWAWPRAPAVGAVLETSRMAELRRWGPSPEGSA